MTVGIRTRSAIFAFAEVAAHGWRIIGSNSAHPHPSDRSDIADHASQRRGDVQVSTSRHLPVKIPQTIHPIHNNFRDWLLDPIPFLVQDLDVDAERRILRKIEPAIAFLYHIHTQLYETSG